MHCQSQWNKPEAEIVGNVEDEPFNSCMIIKTIALFCTLRTSFKFYPSVLRSVQHLL